MRAGAARTWSPDGLLVEGRHCYGGTRMGTIRRRPSSIAMASPTRFRNLGIIGASTFPTAGGANPTLTVQALAWRTAHHLVATAGERLDARPTTPILPVRNEPHEAARSCEAR